MKLNLGCENDMWGDIRVDRMQTSASTHVADLQNGLPFIEDNTIFEVHAYSILEHIHNFIFLMDEIFRVCIEDAKLDIVVPYWTWNGAVADPQHCRMFNEETWQHYDCGCLNLLKRSGIKHGCFKTYEIILNPLPNQDIEDRFHKINIVHEMRILTTVGKVRVDEL